MNGYFALLDRFGCERASEKMDGFKELTQKVHPLALGAVNRLFEETKLVGLRLLSTRAKPFPEEDNHEIIRKLSAEVYSHSHAINRTEANKYLGLKHVKKSEDLGLDEEIWNLYQEYKDLFQLESPFQPEEHLIVNDLDENQWADLPFACVESADRLDVCRKSLRVRKLRNIPPTLNVNLNNLAFPAITFPNIQPPPDPQMIQALVQQIVQATLQQSLNQAVQSAVDTVMRALPQKGFEQFTYNSGWREEQ